MPKKLNLGCGNKIFNSSIDSWVNIDFINAKGVDLVLDLNKFPYPFKTNSVDEVYCDNILEHLNDFDAVLKEIHRILKKGGILTIKVPYFSNPGAFNPNHRSYFNFFSLDMYFSNEKERSDAKQALFFLEEKKLTFLDEYKKGTAKIALAAYFFLPKLIYKINPKAYTWLFSYIFPASEIHFRLRK